MLSRPQEETHARKLNLVSPTDAMPFWILSKSFSDKSLYINKRNTRFIPVFHIQYPLFQFTHDLFITIGRKWHLLMRSHSNRVISSIESHELRLEHDVSVDLKVALDGLDTSEASYPYRQYIWSGFMSGLIDLLCPVASTGAKLISVPLTVAMLVPPISTCKSGKTALQGNVTPPTVWLFTAPVTWL